MSRRTFLKAGAATLGGLSAASLLRAAEDPSTRKSDQSRPNILIIICDQMNLDAISAYKQHYTHPARGPHWVHTPNLDRLVRRGVSFLESHSCNPVCSPARSSIFTGRMTIETGIIHNNIGIDKDVPNMGQWFDENSDYDRVYCGKWHAGGKWNYPEVSGNRKIPGFDTMPVGNGPTGDISDYQVSTSVEAYIRNHSAGNPFLIVAGLMNPHDICFWAIHSDVVTARTDEFDLGEKLPVLPPNHTYSFREPAGGPFKRFSEIQWRNYIYDYYRMIEKLDGDVGRMLDAVESRSDDTIIIFTSDHGEGRGRHGRVQKWHPYDESVKVPLIISCPGRFRENVIDDMRLVSGVDIMPTVCDYAGIKPPPNQRGRSLRPLLEGRTNVEWQDNVYSELQHTGRMIRTSRYKYVKFYERSRDQDKPFITADGSVAQFIPGHGHEYRANPVKLLFDMKEDPWETVNLADDPKYADVIAAHEKILKEEYEAHLIPGVHYDRN